MNGGLPIRTRARSADAVLGALVVAVLAMMVVPLPTVLLDLLIASNLALAALLLLVSLAIKDGLAFAAMPTVLLITTLYRLALNVSSTRLILLQADAGQVIRAFGDFVVQGNYVVGGVVFLILTLVQYVVVARGAERVAEVGARFTLDAMPGKQLAIDSELRAGTLTAEGARHKRRVLEREGQFYGAMDGAMKFVKGDAIAGIAIVFVNVIAGTAIGVGMRGLPVGESLRLYGLLTIGDGLVTQIPSLLIATSAGLVVTRVASSEESGSLGYDVATQIFGNPRVLLTGAGLLALLAIVPGLPLFPFAVLAALLVVVAYGLMRVERQSARTSDVAPRALRALAEPSLLRIELGSELDAELSRGAAGALEAEVEQVRARIARELGLPLGAIDVEGARELGAREYRITLAGAPVASGVLEQSRAGRDAAEDVARALERCARGRASELLGLEETQALLDAASASAPALVRQLVPQPISPRLLTEVLRRLLAERVRIRPLRPILEALASEADTSLDAATLVERVRTRLSRNIGFSLAHEGTLRVHRVDAQIEDALRDAVQGQGAQAYLALAPDLAEDILACVRATLADSSAHTAVLITQADVRRWLRALLAPELPDVAVLSYAELAPDARVEQLAPVRIGGRAA